MSLSPKAAHRLKKQPWFFIEMDDSHRVRQSEAYKRAYTDRVVSLGCVHIIEAAPPDKWSEARLTAVARKSTDKAFGLL